MARIYLPRLLGVREEWAGETGGEDKDGAEHRYSGLHGDLPDWFTTLHTGAAVNSNRGGSAGRDAGEPPVSVTREHGGLEIQCGILCFSLARARSGGPTRVRGLCGACDLASDVAGQPPF